MFWPRISIISPQSMRKKKKEDGMEDGIGLGGGEKGGYNSWIYV